MIVRRLLAAAGIAGALALVGAPAFAQSNCAALCAVQCVKPITIPDRWDDSTPIAGYTAGSRRGNWQNNNAWDSEAFTDTNGNGLWDSGETFVDGNANGTYDAELYDPATTGYRPSVDLGLELLLKADNDAKSSPGQYLSVALPPVNRGTPIVNDGDDYSANWMACNSVLAGNGDVLQLQPGNLIGLTNTAMRNLVAQDPDAYWDPITQSIQGSQFPQSPRVLFVPVHDPRIPIFAGHNVVVVTKVVAFFMEQMEGNAEVRGRFLRAGGTGSACAGGADGFIVECPTPARGTSWGRVKDL